MNLNNNKNTGDITNQINDNDDGWFQIPLKNRIKILENKKLKGNQISQEENKNKKEKSKEKKSKVYPKKRKFIYPKEEFDNAEDNEDDDNNKKYMMKKKDGYLNIIK